VKTKKENKRIADPEGAVALGFIPNLTAFVIGLGIAYFNNWEVQDMVWSLWLCSLVLGFLTMLATIGAGAYIGLRVIRQNDFDWPRQFPVIAFGIAIGLFILGFFSLHFGAFHAGHSVFLQLYFPIEGMPNDGFGSAFMNPARLWIMVFQHLIKPYGLFLIPTIIVERQAVFKSLFETVRNIQTGNTQLSGDVGDNLSKTMFRPYINVVRMHLLIFFFAFCYAINVQSFIVFATVYFVYFFPWPELKKLKRS